MYLLAKSKILYNELFGFAYGESEVSFASQCVFTTLRLGEEAAESMSGVTDYLVEQIGCNPFSPLIKFITWSTESPGSSPPSPQPQTGRGDRAFENVAPKVWNRLPLEVRQCQSLNTFKVLLKTHLFELAFY